MKEFEELSENDNNESFITNDFDFNKISNEKTFEETESFNGIDSNESNTLFSFEFESHKNELFQNDNAQSTNIDFEENQSAKKQIETNSNEQKNSNIPDFYTKKINEIKAI